MKNTTVIVGILSALSILVCLSGSTAYAQLRQGELDLNKLHNYVNQLVPKDINGNKKKPKDNSGDNHITDCLLYTSPSPRDKRQSRMPSSA